MITQILSSDGEVVSLHCSTHDHYVPFDPANRDYQSILDAIIEQGANCFDGDIPEDLQAAADQRQFDKQLNAYRIAKARLEEYAVADGRSEVTETLVMGQEYSAEADGMVDVTETVVVLKAIDPVPATVEITTADEEGNAVTETIENPLITKDNEERAAAQAVVDATPQAVKDAA